MMKVFTKLAFLSIIIITTSCSNRFTYLTEITSTAQMQADVNFLADDKLEGRAVGSRGELIASKYIAKRFKDLDLSPLGDDGTYFQGFTFTPKLNPHAMGPATDQEPINGKNVIAFKDNGADQTIIIGAHYDHLGYGGSGSLFIGEPAIHNGADDNASGVAGLLHLAAKLAANTNTKSNYIFIAFSGEERGLWGSNYYTDNPTYDLGKISFMINLDMIGRLDTQRGLAVNGTGTSTMWNDVLEDANVEEIHLIKTESGVGPSDHTSFYYVDIPVLHFFTGQHEDYHKPSDDADKINYSGIKSVSELVYRIVDDLDDEAPLVFTKTEDKSENQMTSFKVTLGVMPDYLYDQKGMRIDGVKEERPAALAGIEKGDIILQMGDVEVNDIYDYMGALGKFSKGQTIEVKVKRGDEVLTREVTF